MVCFDDAVWNPQQADMYVCGYSGTCELLVVVYWIFVDIILGEFRFAKCVSTLSDIVGCVTGKARALAAEWLTHSAAMCSR